MLSIIGNGLGFLPGILPLNIHCMIQFLELHGSHQDKMFRGEVRYKTAQNKFKNN